ncbi:hypothetical protein P3T27_004757 [Kitasatospora sp. MAA19]|uniref:hypothetical protein n=1 Tax=Kitasatospora sp. MAA19 TaxID=3035090 RepID=UPI002475CAB3|nr:hypothetical protein [Kitasatospora sp. MAA19]MDH6708020.1 hypothetical protein [Kitasatospora sp. MAA19]
MGEYINPRYAHVVEWYRQQQVSPDPEQALGRPVFRADDEPVPPRLGFLMEPVPSE